MFIDKNVYKALDGDFLFENIRVKSPYGREMKKNMKPFYYGDEENLILEHNNIDEMMNIIKSKSYSDLRILLLSLKELRGTIETAQKNDVLTEVEIYYIKILVFQLKAIGEILKKENSTFEILPLKEIENILNPVGAHENSFYLYDSYSQALANARNARSQAEREKREEEKRNISVIEKTFNMRVSRDSTLIVSKEKTELIKQLENSPLVQFIRENTRMVIFAPKETEIIVKLKERISECIKQEESESFVVRKNLSKEIGSCCDTILKNLNTVARLDLCIAKAEFAERENLTRPVIIQDNQIDIKNGRYLKTEKMLEEKGEKFTPISIKLLKGTQVITGANMGGKTVSLKLVGLCQWMAQYGLFVPCEYMSTCLLSFIRTSIGDHQSTNEGLSTFGAEIKHLISIFSMEEDRGLLLIDELARGTNPKEGNALSVAIAQMLQDKSWISLISTHFEGVSKVKGARNYQVKGLKKNILNNLTDIEGEDLSKFMDYRLEEISGDVEVPKDALKIANLLGLDPQIIQNAEKIIENE